MYLQSQRMTVNICPICVIFLYVHFLCPVNLNCGLASLLLWETFETFPKVPPLRFLSSRNGTAGPLSGGSTAPNPCYRVLQQKTTTWKVFLVEFRGNLTLDGQREQRGGTAWVDGLGDEIVLITKTPSPHPSLSDGRFFFLSGWCNSFMTDWARMYPRRSRSAQIFL